MLFNTLFATLALANGIAGYTLAEDYMSGDFFDKFSFFTGADPTGGFVDFVDQSDAQKDSLINTNNGAYIGVDSETNNPSNGRAAVRLTSTASYNAGTMVIIDLAHMPAGICGTWPAFWMVGSNWPNNGEIDIIEGVNLNTENQMTLHTSDDCTIQNSGFSGNLVTSNCYVDAPGQSTNQGCSIQDPSEASYGAGFNSNGGGVFATVWGSSSIDIYFWGRNSIPSNINSGNPDPSAWGNPKAHYAGNCDISSHFRDMQLVFDTTFCGQWAGAAWGSSSCNSEASSCQAYVADNPSAFSDAYWQVNSLKVYTANGSTSDVELVANGTTPLNATAEAEVVKRQAKEYLRRHRGKRHQPHRHSEYE